MDNPGPGGWAALLQYTRLDGEKAERELRGTCSGMTTNNRMELTAVIQGLGALNRPCRVAVHTDSKYIFNAMTRWLPGWKRRGWRKTTGEPVQNRDLWEALDEASQAHRVTWFWIKAHSKHPENERVDEIAHAAAHEAAESAQGEGNHEQPAPRPLCSGR